MRTYAGLLRSAAPDLGDGMSLTTMLVIALVGLLVVTFGGLALAVGLGFLTTRRRGGGGGRDGGTGVDDGDGSDGGTQPDSAGTPFK
ncbi:hypothetical protein [Terrabacter sp. Root181]|uniref:hypothetical protein n=1 Tax=Terrabacter sp. Root181 TaxID=1736484 RepID=UPI0007018ED0|nr:hypothetical protein [Terrabacter sp. Root181]KRB44174.1 hypothetical protein ASD90_17290 [Terrabacter sp. Root181]